MPRNRTKPSSGLIYIARDSFACEVDGQPITVVAGLTRVREGHKLLAGREMFFEPLTVHYDVEEATEAPPVEEAITVPGKSRDDA